MSAHVVRDGQTGAAVISGTGISVVSILRELAASSGADAVLSAHPELTADALAAAISFAAAAVEREVPYDFNTVAAPLVVRERALAGGYGAARSPVWADEYDGLLEEVGLLRELCAAQAEVAAGETVSSEEALAFFRSHFGG